MRFTRRRTTTIITAPPTIKQRLTYDEAIYQLMALGAMRAFRPDVAARHDATHRGLLEEALRVIVAHEETCGVESFDEAAQLDALMAVSA